MSVDVARFERLWSYALQESRPNPDGAVGALMDALARTLAAEIVEYSANSDAATFLLDLGAQPFRGMGLNVVMVVHPPRDEEESRRIARLLADYREEVRSIGLCIMVVLQEDEPAANPHVPGSTDVVYMAREDLRRIFSSRVPSAALFSVIKRYMYLERLNPFNTTEVARGSMFIGRKREVERLVREHDTHFLVMGARLVGKTSLLLRARDMLCMDREMRSRVWYLDCSTWGGYKDCVTRLMTRLDPKRERRAEISLREVTYLLRRLSHDGRRPLLLFFDEADRLTVRDGQSDWPFMRLLAEAVAAGWIRVVFAGFRDVQALRQDWSNIKGSPFLGGLEMLSLNSLSRDEARSLLCDPLVAADISIASPEAVDRILDHSAGQPFIVQFYGEHLYQIASESSCRQVTIDHVRAIEESDELSGFLMNHFVWNTEDGTRAANDERACVLLYVHLAGSEPWTQQDFEVQCDAHYLRLDMSQTTLALQNLLHAQIFRPVGRRYALAFPLLRDILRDAYPDLDSAMAHLREAQ